MQVLFHPRYYPNLESLLFLALHNSFAGKIFNDLEDVKTAAQQFFDSIPHEFHWRGIHVLREKWQEVIDCNDNYV